MVPEIERTEQTMLAAVHKPLRVFDCMYRRQHQDEHVQTACYSLSRSTDSANV